MIDKIKLGKTGIEVNRNGFGALPIQRVSIQESTKILRRAYEAGIEYYDTSRAYSDSEKKLGIALSDVRNKICLATKTKCNNVDDFWSDLNRSLELLNTDYIDVYQFHNPSFYPRPNDGTGLYEAMLEAREKGIIRHIGITNHRIRLAFEIVESGLYETIQFPFSYLATDEEKRLVNLCKEKEVGYIAMKALSGGLLNDSRAAYGFMTQYDNVLPIWGIQKMNELEEFIAHYESKVGMDSETEEKILKDRKELSGDFCRGCGYCLPCPAGIEIPNAARMSLMIRRAPEASWLSEEWQAKMSRIDDCIHCNHCSDNCPYFLDTPELLKRNLEDYKNFL